MNFILPNASREIKAIKEVSLNVGSHELLGALYAVGHGQASIEKLAQSFSIQCESKKISPSTAEHGAAAHEEALGTARKGLTVGFSGPQQHPHPLFHALAPPPLETCSKVFLLCL